MKREKEMTMFKPTTYNQLTACMQTGAIVSVNGIVGVINCIYREDGSGKCWNVVVQCGTDAKTVFVRAE